MKKRKLHLLEEKDKPSYAAQYMILQQCIFFGILVFGFIITVVLFPMRPSFSETEKRELAQFPAFSFQKLWSGEYFRGIDTWFSDTFPARDEIMNINAVVRKMHGIRLGKVEVHGNVEQGDDIPSAVVVSEEPQSDETTSSEEVSSEEISSQDSVSSAPPENDVTGKDTQALGALLIVGDSAYEYYNFNKEVAQSYAAKINAAAGKMPGINTYCMVVPNSMDIVLPKELRDSINTSDQRKAIEFLNGSMSSSVKPIAVFDAIKAHCDEYVYFRTDHHWTALGAYYAYEELMKQKGMQPVPLSDFKKHEFDNFIGAFYADSGKKAELKKNPDTVIAYEPNCNATFKFTDRKGNVLDWKIISDVSGWTSSTKYSTFVGGDNPYSVITNNDLSDGSSCVIVKESYANALIPFLVPHYQTIYIVDYRYWSGSVPQFAKNNNVQDVYFINNISMTRNKKLVEKLGKIL